MNRPLGMIRMKRLLAVFLFSALAACHAQTPKKKIVDKNGHEWPECIPPSELDRKTFSGGVISFNGTHYTCSEDGHWVVDQKAVVMERNRRQKQADLLYALVTRKLSRDELNHLSSDANIFPNQPYFACVKYAELYDMLVKQWEIRNDRQMPFRVTLSRALGEYNRCPQEHENRAAVEDLICVLQNNP